MSLNVERLARAEDIVSRRHHDPEHGPYRGLDNDPILASMMREEAAELAAEYDRLGEVLGTGTPVPEARELPSGDARIEALA